MPSFDNSLFMRSKYELNEKIIISEHGVRSVNLIFNVLSIIILPLLHSITLYYQSGGEFSAWFFFYCL